MYSSHKHVLTKYKWYKQGEREIDLPKPPYSSDHHVLFTMPAQPKTSHQLQGQKAVVIGGSSGIGFAVASALVEEGVHVVIASSTQSKIDAAVAKLSDPEQQYNADAKRVEGRTVNLKGPEMEVSQQV